MAPSAKVKAGAGRHRRAARGGALGEEAAAAMRDSMMK